MTSRRVGTVRVRPRGARRMLNNAYLYTLYPYASRLTAARMPAAAAAAALWPPQFSKSRRDIYITYYIYDDPCESGDYLPLKTGGLRSRKLATPSLWSSVCISR